MDKPARYKSKTKKPAAKPKTTKKRKSDTKPDCGPTCSMFLAEITKKLAAKRRQEEESPKNIVQTIIESLTNALPVIFSKKTPEKKESPMKIETLQTFAPELLPNDTLSIPHPQPIEPYQVEEDHLLQQQDVATTSDRTGFKMPKMPLVSSEVIKVAIEKRRRSLMQDASMNTGEEHDMASELVKHVSTLRKISLIAEEFNQKTAKNLKEIVDSVQEDLVKKLEEIQAEQSAAAQAVKLQATKESVEKEETIERMTE